MSKIIYTKHLNKTKIHGKQKIDFRDRKTYW